MQMVYINILFVLETILIINTRTDGKKSLCCLVRLTVSNIYRMLVNAERRVRRKKKKGKEKRKYRLVRQVEYAVDIMQRKERKSKYLKLDV